MEKRLAIGLIEAINGLLQLAKCMARSFRSYKHFQVMDYVKAAKLKPQLPLALPTRNSEKAFKLCNQKLSNQTCKWLIVFRQ